MSIIFLPTPTGKMSASQSILVLVVGSLLFVSSVNSINTQPVKQVMSSTPQSVGLELVKEEFKKIESSDDKILIYKLFAGSSDYLTNVKTLTQTSQFDPVLGRVQTSYGWSREKYPKFTDAVEVYLKEVKYDEPKKLSSPEDIAAFQKIFADLAEATKYE